MYLTFTRNDGIFETKFAWRRYTSITWRVQPIFFIIGIAR